MLFSKGRFDPFLFPDIVQQPIDVARRVVIIRKLVRWHMIKIPAYRVATNYNRMGADNFENEFRWKKPPVVLAQGETLTLRERMGQSAFVFHPMLKSEGAFQDPFSFIDGAKRREPFAYRQFRGFLPEGNDPIKLKRSALQISLFLGCPNQGLGCDGAVYVHSLGLQCFANISKLLIVGDANAFLPTGESDLYERNSDR